MLLTDADKDVRRTSANAVMKALALDVAAEVAAQHHHQISVRK